MSDLTSLLQTAAKAAKGLTLCRVLINSENMPPGASPQDGAWALLGRVAADAASSGWARHQSSVYWFDAGKQHGKAIGKPLYAQWRDSTGRYELTPANEDAGLLLRNLAEYASDDGRGDLALRQQVSVCSHAPANWDHARPPKRMSYSVYWGPAPEDDISAITRLHHWFEAFTDG